MNREEYRQQCQANSPKYNCCSCGSIFRRRLGGADRRNGNTPRFCSMSCRRDVPVSPYWAGYCQGCALPMGGKMERKRCDPCRRAAAASAARAALVALHVAAAKVVRCSDCGCAFCPVYGAQGVSVRCAPCADVNEREITKAAKLRRRIAKMGAAVETVRPSKVFERDGWSCYLCGKATPRHLRGSSHPDAPEVEHVVPLSRGGEHSYANTRCACRKCNCAKGSLTHAEMVGAVA